MSQTANPAPSPTFGDIFNRFTTNAFTFGTNYLTLKGQLELAEKTAEAQAQLNAYNRVNPSLGPVNPYAAQQEANKTLPQKFLPSGSPVVGTPDTGTGSVTMRQELLKWGMLALLGVLFFILVRKAIRA
jgi:hypothetical protein